ncbi:MAG: hypothetical protein ACOVR6_00030, partial [Fimbriimonas sp.]
STGAAFFGAACFFPLVGGAGFFGAAFPLPFGGTTVLLASMVPAFFLLLLASMGEVFVLPFEGLLTVRGAFFLRPVGDIFAL